MPRGHALEKASQAIAKWVYVPLLAAEAICLVSTEAVIPGIPMEQSALQKRTYLAGGNKNSKPEWRRCCKMRHGSTDYKNQPNDKRDREVANGHAPVVGGAVAAGAGHAGQGRISHSRQAKGPMKSQESGYTPCLDPPLLVATPTLTPP